MLKRYKELERYPLFASLPPCSLVVPGVPFRYQYDFRLSTTDTQRLATLNTTSTPFIGEWTADC